jgi:hypothetical protein
VKGLKLCLKHQSLHSFSLTVCGRQTNLHLITYLGKYTDIWVYIIGKHGRWVTGQRQSCIRCLWSALGEVTAISLLTRLVGALSVSFHITQNMMPVSLPLIQNRLMVAFQNPNSKQKVKTYVREGCPWHHH